MRSKLRPIHCSRHTRDRLAEAPRARRIYIASTPLPCCDRIRRTPEWVPRFGPRFRFRDRVPQDLSTAHPDVLIVPRRGDRPDVGRFQHRFPSQPAECAYTGRGWRDSASPDTCRIPRRYRSCSDGLIQRERRTLQYRRTRYPSSPRWPVVFVVPYPSGLEAVQFSPVDFLPSTFDTLGRITTFVSYSRPRPIGRHKLHIGSQTKFSIDLDPRTRAFCTDA